MRRRVSRGRDSDLGRRRGSCPHQHGALVVHRELFDLNQLHLEVFEVGVIDTKLPLERPIGRAALPLQDLDHAGDAGGVLGVSQRGVAKQRVDGRQAGVAGPGAVAAVLFEVGQERADRGRVEVGEVQPAGRLAGLLLRETEQQPEGVAVGGDRARAGVALGHQPVGEERLQFLAQLGQGVVQGTIFKSLTFGGQQGFDVQNVPSARYLLTVVLFLYVPYLFVSPIMGVFIDRFPRRRVLWVAALITAGTIAIVAVGVLAPLGSGTTEGKTFSTAGLILALIGVQTCVRVVLAVKSAALPDVLSGKDLLQGNSVSQAGGGFFQPVGIAVGGVAAGLLPVATNGRSTTMSRGVAQFRKSTPCERSKSSMVRPDRVVSRSSSEPEPFSVAKLRKTSPRGLAL